MAPKTPWWTEVSDIVECPAQGYPGLLNVDRDVMKPHIFLSLYAALALALAFFTICLHLGFWLLPAAFFALGLISALLHARRALLLFLFLLPLINSSPDILFNGYPFNYMGVILFYLSGLVCAAFLHGRRPIPQGRWLKPYLWFLTLLFISVMAVLVRWSNLTLSFLAFLRDTPVAPGGERLSFALISPVITLFIFAMAPFLPALLQQEKLSPGRALRPVLAGFGFSLLLALGQRFLFPDFLTLRWWVEKMRQPNGGFSDFNAFGFFAGALFLYATVLAVHFHQRRMHQAGRQRFYFILFFLLATLGGVFLSGCRTALLFVMVGGGYVLLSRRVTRFWKVTGVTVVLVLLLLFGGTLKQRLKLQLGNFLKARNTTEWVRALDAFSNIRLTMMKNSLPMIAMAPLSGVGAGNFLFCHKALYFGRNFYEDLPLNQYLLVLNETGLIGLFFFVILLGTAVRRRRPSALGVLNSGMLLALFFNNFFWFPEVLLLFWIINSRAEPEKALRNSVVPGIALPLLLGIFTCSQFFTFSRLQPLRFCLQHDRPYQYGFCYSESNRQNLFHWSGKAAGWYLTEKESGSVLVCCDDPLSKFPDGRQTVDVYWQGRFRQRLTFTTADCRTLAVAGTGFLEFRVQPAFKLKKMGIGRESRDLGVWVYLYR